MTTYTIQNQYIKVGIASKGAELQEIFNKQNNLNYLWSGDAAFWGKKSPVLFPIVGGLKNNEYTYRGKTYSLPRHGFARDKEFELVEKMEHALMFRLCSDQETLKVYPFEFELFLIYALANKTIRCTYMVLNKNPKQNLLFSIGAHPAFHVPLLCTTTFEDWYLQFNKEEKANIYPLTKDGLIMQVSVPYLLNTHKLPLKKELFYGDALVFKNLKSREIKLLSNTTKEGFSFKFSNFPFFGIWAAKDAPFICLEPWCGIADSENTSGNLEDKEGIISLPPDDMFQEYWEVEIL